MTRRVLTDGIWAQLQSVMAANGCYDAKNSREIMEGILWKLRTGVPWRDIPREFCSWETAYGRFNSWAAKGLWANFFLSYEARLIQSGYSPTEVTSALTSHANGARLGEERAIGKSRGGPTTKIHMACDAHGNPIDFEITGGEVHDAKAAPQVISKVKGAENFIADKGYDSEDIRELARAGGMNPVIPRKSNSKKPNPEFDSHFYKMRHLVENLFARLKHFRSIATRFEKLARNFKAYQLAKEHYWHCKELKLPSFLKDQLLRASSSVALTLAEGSGKRTPADQRRFYAMAYESFRECQAIAELEKVNDTTLKNLQDQLGAMLFTLSRKNC